MRNPWQSDSNDAELEALQTDVMRFVAILGLCLAAIFSMVQRASLEQAPPLVHPGDLVPTQAPPITPAEMKQRDNASPAAVPAPAQADSVAAEPSTQVASQVEFSLEFASAADLMALLESGQIQLYADHDGQFWSADPRGRFTITEAPTSYYAMDSGTVPEALIGSLQRSTAAAQATWGVVLAPAIVEQMTEFTSAREGGRLLILGTGQVVLE